MQYVLIFIFGIFCGAFASYQLLLIGLKHRIYSIINKKDTCYICDQVNLIKSNKNNE